jgi:protein N-terminal amidase
MDVKLVLCSMNWLASEPPNEASKGSDEWTDVADTLSYWATRMSPVIGKDTIFLACNRIGTERGTTFTGSSCAMRLARQAAVLAYAGKTDVKLVRSTVQVL